MIGFSQIPTDPREISRVSLEPHNISEDEQLHALVLEQAHKEFGYVGESFGARGPLARALTALGIEPLQSAMVEQYMASKEREWQTNWQPLVRTMCILLPMMIAGAIVLIANAYGAFKHETPDWITFTMVFGTVMLFIVGQLLTNDSLYNWIDPKHQRFERFWKTFAMDEKSNVPRYQGYVPVHVLSKALSIRKVLPEAKLYVHELTLRYSNVPKPEPLPDPFLEVTLGSESYWVEVWDEREFEAKL